MRNGYLFNIHIDEDDKLPKYQNKQIIKDYEEGYQAIKELNQLQEGIKNLFEYIFWIEKYTTLFERNLYYDKKGATKFYDFFITFLRIRKLKYFTYEMYKFVEQKGDLEFLEIDTTKIEEVLT